MRVQPLATYRLQLTPGFTLHDAARLVPYLRDLGMSHVYLSPILEASAGSAHGYDVTDPWSVRAELGGEDGMDALTVATRTAGLGILLDIVPNHMAASIENPWWRDLLEFGLDSPHAGAFDLSWRSDADQRRILLPVLGDELTAVLEAGEIRLHLDDTGLLLSYGERAFPVTPAAYAVVLESLELVGREPPRGFDPEPFQVLDPPALLDIPADPYRRERAVAARDALLRQIAGAGAAEPLRRAIASWNERPAADREDVLEAVLDRQAYELAFWRRSLREITYRRFFDVSDLVGVNVRDPAVLAATHRRILTLVAGSVVDGLRIDHVDGLRDPSDYLEQLARAGGDAPPYVVVEKILASDEALPAEWDAAGTTGYDFITALDGWFIHPDGWTRLRDAYCRFTGRTEPFEEIAYRSQRDIIDALFGGEFRALLRQLTSIARASGRGAVDEDHLARALRETSACLSVYRTYIRSADVSQSDRERIEQAVDAAAARAPELASDVLPWLRDVLLLAVPDRVRPDAVEFVLRWQQFTGPVMAKGFEDTALYNDFTLSSANEVGGHPGAPATSTASLHAFFFERARSAPRGLNGASTHDTKRGEDARARIAVLSELPDEWARFLDERDADRAAGPDPATPSPADRVLLYQTLLATWPGSEPDDRYVERIAAYMTKAAREAKARTSWRDSDEEYEEALANAVGAAVDPAGPTHHAIDRLARRLAFPAALAALSRALVRVTAPGVPDTYQGAELWHDALVDPDNRRPVDYDERRAALDALRPVIEEPDPARIRALVGGWKDGRIKLYVLARSLARRAHRRALYEEGAYRPVEVAGPGSDRILAYARRSEDDWSITVVARWFAAAADASWSPADLRGTSLRLPDGAPRLWTESMTGRAIPEHDGRPALEDILAVLPVALLEPA